VGLEKTFGFQEVDAVRNSRHSTHEGGKVVSLRHRSPLLHRKYPWYSFLLDTESKPGP